MYAVEIVHRRAFSRLLVEEVWRRLCSEGEERTSQRRVRADWERRYDRGDVDRQLRPIWGVL